MPPDMKALTANDYQVWGDVEDVTIFPAPRNDLVQFPAKNVFRRAPTCKEMTASGGAYTSQDLVFLVPVPTSQPIDGQFPFKPGDLVRDHRLVSWTILEASPIVWGNLWRLTTRNLVLAARLHDEISIIRPAIAVGDAAEPVYDFTIAGGATYVAENLAARVQPTGVEIGVRNDVQSAQTRFTVILGQQVELRSNDRVLVTKGDWTGKTLQWTSIRNQERIDELPAVECTRV